ncbi:MAG: BirA family transcriptional regulator [Actinomycetota bacterium]|nr:BirA family transcriptional regulator [Actinomycetota bacterium]
MDTGTLERALVAVGLRAPVRWDEVTGSTNQVAAAMAAEGFPEWSIAAAGHQTAGRGRLGRTWEDEPGSSLMCSVVLRPAGVAPEQGGWLSLMAGVALAEGARTLTGRDIRCKWPNDLLLDGAKVGGILVESQVFDGRLAVAIVGTGVNLKEPEGIAGAAGLGGEVDPEALLIAYLRALVDLYHPNDAGFADAISERWRSLSATIGSDVGATTVDGREVRGTATDLDPRGGLILATELGPVTVTSGEVEHLG